MQKSIFDKYNVKTIKITSKHYNEAFIVDLIKILFIFALIIYIWLFKRRNSKQKK